MKRAAFILGGSFLPVGWMLAAGGLGMVGHMAGHMIAVALAAPLLAYGLSGGRYDLAGRWPGLLSPMAMMLVELFTVWAWHLPALRALADRNMAAMVVEQGCFLMAGWMLWGVVFHAPQRAAGIGALLLTSMHMTLLGALIGLAPRPLYAHMQHSGGLSLDALADQQLGGVIMLMVGASSYFLGGLLLLASLLRDKGVGAA
ncbi:MULTISPECIES: cytochrome c oxidase assembly protein [Sphingobium]|uniref:Membrane protein n=2 Tax=Sphingobium cupriresistens TaxID=1132417 RepID=A0A0J7Y2J5_9SPHN|nr:MULTISPECIES: cytochrome c oxidase assembly protein [Sphingobium]KMS58156.1 membrane protein [Sphingobium cupriresistens LL01]MBJ7377351.1 cytochrome c oxidase assembly protein [Sphingobium sp.]RYM06251.1 hypothetical protein EWH12_20390 [Sphingobium cupriresistens]